MQLVMINLLQLRICQLLQLIPLSLYLCIENITNMKLLQQGALQINNKTDAKHNF